MFSNFFKWKFSPEASVVFWDQVDFGQIGNFSSGIGKKHTFWHWEWGRISTPNPGDREPWGYYHFGIRNDRKTFKCMAYK